MQINNSYLNLLQLNNNVSDQEFNVEFQRPLDNPEDIWSEDEYQNPIPLEKSPIFQIAGDQSSITKFLRGDKSQKSFKFSKICSDCGEKENWPAKFEFPEDPKFYEIGEQDISNVRCIKKNTSWNLIPKPCPLMSDPKEDKKEAPAMTKEKVEAQIFKREQDLYTKVQDQNFLQEKQNKESDVYIQRAQKTIDDSKIKLKQSAEIPLKERKRLRNNISANQNYILRKREPIVLLKQIENKDRKFKQFVDLLSKEIGSDEMQHLCDNFLKNTRKCQKTSESEQSQNGINDWFFSSSKKIDDYKLNQKIIEK